MLTELVDEQEIRKALSRHRPNASDFASKVDSRINDNRFSDLQREGVPSSPFIRIAAGLLPSPWIGNPLLQSNSYATSTTFLYKLFGWITFPAVCLFALVAVALFSFWKIQSVQEKSNSQLEQDLNAQKQYLEWLTKHKWATIFVVVGSLGAALTGTTSFMFVLYLISFALLVYAISSLTESGVGNRQMLSEMCTCGLVFLAQISAFTGMGKGQIHFLDQLVIPVIFLLGTCVLLLFNGVDVLRNRIILEHRAWVGYIAFLSLIVVYSFVALYFFPPPTRAGLKQYVESFDKARFSTATWSQWEIGASWSIEAGLAPDLTKPRILCDKTIAVDQNPFILADALRTDLLQASDISNLSSFEPGLKRLLDSKESESILSLRQSEWIIRAALLSNVLGNEGRALIKGRLIATLDEALTYPKYVNLEDVLVASELLKMIDPAFQFDTYRSQIHEMLLRFHTTTSGGFQLAGGFVRFLDSDSGHKMPGTVESTAHAVSLMKVYGIPKELNQFWLQSYLKHSWITRMGDEKWMAYASLQRFNSIDGSIIPKWYDYLAYEYNIVAAMLFTVLCLYSTLSAPIMKNAALPFK